MAIAYQCDRCKKLVAGHPYEYITSSHDEGYHLCEDCSDSFDKFVYGATLGLDKETAAQLFNTLNDAWAFAKQDEITELVCSNCYHHGTCDSYSRYSDASQCKQFVSARGIVMDAKKKQKLMHAVEECLNILNEYM